MSRRIYARKLSTEPLGLTVDITATVPDGTTADAWGRVLTSAVVAICEEFASALLTEDSAA